MKRISLLLFVLLISISASAQPPEQMTYQAVIRDNDNYLLANTEIRMRISILQSSASGLPVYEEVHQPTTNENGLVSIVIGSGTVLAGDFSLIDWSADSYFLKTETDPEGENNFTITGVSQLLSVPYALYSKTAGTTVRPATETDPLFAEAEEGDLITYDGSNWAKKKALLDSTGGTGEVNNMQPWLGINFIIALQGVFPSRNGADPFVAEVIMFAGNFAPRGWAFCDGQLLSISTNSALFSLLGTTYGGDGRTTFALPDLRGRVPVHPGTGQGLTNRRLGEKGGTETNTLNVDQMPEHTHNIIYE